MKKITTKAFKGSIIAGTGIIALVLTGCTPGATTSTAPASSGSSSSNDCATGASTDSSLVVGTILPETGNLSYLNPPEISGVGLAVSDINAAGGVAGKKACVLATDSGDSTDLTVSTASAPVFIGNNLS